MSDTLQLDWLARWNMYSPNKEAFFDVEKNERYSYGTFYRLSNALVPFLRQYNVKKGDRVAVLAQNKIETVFLFFALKRLGAILVPINFRLSAPEVDYIIKDSGASHLFIESQYNDVKNKLTTITEAIDMATLVDYCARHHEFSQEFAYEGGFSDPCKILYTSGTTGFPKGVMITPEVLFWNSITTAMSLDLTSRDCMISFLPLFHTGGWNVLLTPFIHHGARTVFLPNFDGDQILSLCDQEKVTVLFGVPTTLAMMSKAPSFSQVTLNSVRFAIVGGEAMPLELIKTWHHKGVPIRQGFGMTEFGPNCFSLSADDAEEKIGSIGRPNFYVQTRIVDEEGQDLAANQVGELLLKGPMCMSGYWNKHEVTKQTVEDGWLKTGDLVKRDPDHYYYVVGRKKEMFISGGENVYPAEIENVLSSHPAIDEVAVVGIKHDKWGEVGKAYLVCKDGHSITKESIVTYCEQNLARFKIPKEFEYLAELPRGTTGKILKRELQQ